MLKSLLTPRLIAAAIAFALLLPLAASTSAAPSQPAQSKSPNSKSPAPKDATDPGDWPMYGHDTARTNYNPAENILSPANVNSWTARWTVAITGTDLPAFSAPSVSNGRVYVGTAADEGDNFFALDATTGALAWSANVGHGADVCFNVGIGSTPAISDTVVTIGGGDAAYYGLNTADGSLLWRVPIDEGPSGFAWSSPLVANNRAYFGTASNCDNPSVRGELSSVDLATGAPQASQYFVPPDQGGAGLWNSPALSPGGGRVIVATGEDYNGYDGPYNRAMISLDSASLNIIQANKQGQAGQDEDWGATPVVFMDRNGRTLVGANHKSGVFYTYDLYHVSDGPIWQRTTDVLVGMMPAYDPSYGDGGTLFIMGNKLYAVDPATGRDLWTPVDVGAALGNMAIANGMIFLSYIGGDYPQGTLLVLDETNGHLLRAITPAHADTTYSGPVVSHGLVYWLTGSTLNVWGLPLAATPTPAVTATSTAPPQVTSTASVQPNTSPTATPTGGGACTIQFADVPPDSAFNAYVRCLACAGAISGYPCGGDAEPCGSSSQPYFRPDNNVTRGAISKMVAISAGYTEDPGEQLFEDVPPGSTYYEWINRLGSRGILGGYPCDTAPDEPCVAPLNRPYFRVNGSATRGQISKIVAQAAGLNLQVIGQAFQDVAPDSPFYPYIDALAATGVIGGYVCGAPNEPCYTPTLPYFRPNSHTTRGQAAKITSGALLPNCAPARRK